MDVTVEDRYGAKPLQIRQRAFAVLRAPSPLWVHRPQRDVCEDDDWRAAREPLDIALQPLELFGPERAEPTGLEVDDVDKADEVDAVLIEAVPARTLGALAEALQVAPAIVLEHVVLAWDVEDGERQFGQHLLQRVKLRRLRQMRQVTRMKDKRRRLGRSLDFRDCGAQRRCDVGVRRLVESDMAVADLDEAERAVSVRHHRRASGLAQRRSFQDAAR